LKPLNHRKSHVVCRTGTSGTTQIIPDSNPPQINMKLFAGSTSDVLLHIFAVWMDGTGLARFDSAMCSTVYRDNFLNLLMISRHHSKSMFRMSTSIQKNSFWEWISVRSITITEVVFSVINCEFIYTNLLLNFERILSLHIFQNNNTTTDINTVVNLVKSCGSLTDLCLNFDIQDSAVVKILSRPNNLKKLLISNKSTSFKATTQLNLLHANLFI
jgi:hypothetical protein